MRVEASKQATPRQLSDFSREVARERETAEAETAESRALVTTEAVTPKTAPVFREAAFLAHLIATKNHAPQTRERRRAEPSEAIAAYRTINALMRG